MIQKYIKNFILAILTLSTFGYGFSASIYLKQVGGAPGTISYDVMLDTELENINALSGELYFDRDLLDFYAIDTANGILSNWMVPPSVSEEISLGAKNKINFEGMVTGGFIGTVSPYSKISAPGKIFNISFVPRQDGETVVSFKNIDLRLNDGLATRINVKNEDLIINIPKITNLEKIKNKTLEGRDIGSETLVARLDKDSSVENGKWFVYFNEDVSRHSVLYYEIAESSDYNPYDVPSFLWHKEKSPYVLKYQSLNNFIHIKAVYGNGNYSYFTLSPVESKRTNDIKVVIIIILMALLSVIVLLREEKEKSLKLHRR